MVSLVDIVPQTRVVQIAAGELTLHGLGLRQIADLYITFPSLRNLFTPGAPEISIAELVVLAPDAIAAAIAEAADQPEAAEALAGGALLTPDEVVDCLTAIFELTFPRGVTPLLERLAALLGVVVVSPDASIGKAAATSAPPPPNSSSHKVIAAAM